MYFLQVSKSFDWRTLLLGEEEWSFLPQVLLRSALMFIIAIIALRLIGRRGIMQGVFELVLIITLGSAAGDPMFYSKVGLLPAAMVFISITLMYRITNYFVGKFEAFEHFIEGKHVRLVQDNRFVIKNFKPEELNKDEILSDLRKKGVSHLGQVDAAYIEASGEMSVFFLSDDKVTFGLPVRPEMYEAQFTKINNKGIYACGYCGFTEEISQVTKHSCKICKNTKWVTALKEKRIK
jgi:uncharacterized membrane protein YcaP (DUF421 family)